MSANKKTPVAIKSLNIKLTDVSLDISENEYKKLSKGMSLSMFLEFIKHNNINVEISDTRTIGRVGVDGVIFDEIIIESKN